jgi:hypothetical protein
MKFNEQAWAERGAFISGADRFIAQIPDPPAQMAGGLVGAIEAGITSGLLVIEQAWQHDAFSFPQVTPQGLHGVARATDIAPPLLGTAPLAVARVRPAFVALFSDLAPDDLQFWLTTLKNGYDNLDKMQRARASGLTLAGPGTKLPPNFRA